MKFTIAVTTLLLAILLTFIAGAYFSAVHTPITGTLFYLTTIAIVCSADWLINKLMWN